MVTDTPTLDQPASEPRENQLRFLITVASRHWLVILCFAVLGLAAFAVVDFVWKEKVPDWVASVDLVVRQPIRERFYTQGLDASAKPRTLIELMSESTLYEDVARELIREDIGEGGPWADIATPQEIGAVTAKISRALFPPKEIAGQGKIRIEARWETKEQAERIAKCAARVFIERSHQSLLEQEQSNYNLLKDDQKDLLEHLEEAELAKTKFLERNYRSPSRELEKWNDLRERLEKIDAEKEALQAKIAQIEGTLQQIDERLPEMLGQIDDSVIRELRDDLTDLVKEKLKLSLEYYDDAPIMLEKEEEIAYLRAEIVAAVAALYGEEGNKGLGDWSKRQQFIEQHTDYQLELIAQEMHEKAIEAQLEEMFPKLHELANDRLKEKQLERQVARLQTRFGELQEKEFEYRPRDGRRLGRVDWRDPVRVSRAAGPGPPVEIWISYLVCGLCGLVFGFFCALLFEKLDTSIRNIEDVTEHIGLEVLGTIPEMKFGKSSAGRRRGAHVSSSDEEQIDACIVTHYDPKSPISEAYRALRTNFQFATIQQKAKTLMVTSAVPGEGKTTTAANLAVTMADQGMRVLLIDTDLRRPNVHRVLRMERGPGLADVLRAGVDYKSVMRPTRVENLWIVSSGRVPPNPSELIGSERMKRFVAQVGQDFDIVICDSPSILVVTDPVLLATHVDAILLVVSVENASRETILRGKKLLESASAQIAGVVLNGVKATRRHYYYYYYYYEDGGGRGKRRWYHLG